MHVVVGLLWEQNWDDRDQLLLIKVTFIYDYVFLRSHSKYRTGGVTGSRSIHGDG